MPSKRQEQRYRQREQRRKQRELREIRKQQRGGGGENNKNRPRRWIYDRINGTSKDDREVGGGGGSSSTTSLCCSSSNRPCCCVLCLLPPYLKCCPWLLEENGCCIRLGSNGYCSDVWSKAVCLKLGLVMNLFSCLLILCSCLALSSDSTLLPWVSFSSAVLTATTTTTSEGTVNALANDQQSILLDVGLSAMLIQHMQGDDTSAASISTNTTSTTDIPSSSSSDIVVVPFDDFCNVDGMDKFIVNEFTNNCHQCYDVSIQLFIAMVIAVVTVLPTCGIDILRTYRHYDMNCLKVSSTILSLCTMVGCIVCYYQYSQVCFNSFLQGTVDYNLTTQTMMMTDNDSSSSTTAATNNDNDDTGMIAQVTYDWSIGTGVICLFAGFVCKVIEFICNCCSTTPTITRDVLEQEEYEKWILLAEEENKNKKYNDDDDDDDSSDSSDDDDCYRA